MRPALHIAAVISAALLLPALSGCGSGSTGSAASSSTEKSHSEAAAERASAKSADAAEKQAEGEAPKGASTTLVEIYRQFPKPKPNPAVKGSAEALKAGEAACRDKTPLEVRESFYAYAVEEGSLEPDSPEAKLIARLPSYEAKASKDAAFVAGQLAADTYQATLPEAIGQFGYQGCVYALARGLKRELAPGG